jgi:hypothetical protein
MMERNHDAVSILVIGEPVTQCGWVVPGSEIGEGNHHIVLHQLL